MPTVPYVVVPPKSMNFVMHNFTSSSDPIFPPSLTFALNVLGPNQFLIQGHLEGDPISMTAEVYNPGTGVAEAYYDSYNVAQGDWLANDTTGYAWIVNNIYTVTDAPQGAMNTGPNYFYALVEDQYAYNAGLDSTGAADGGPQYPDTRVVQFTVDENGIPVFRPTDGFTLSANFTGNILGRFMTVNNYTKQVRIFQTGASALFSVGDPVYINTSTNQFQRSNSLGDVAAIYTTIGIVSSVGIPATDYFTFIPFGKYTPSSQISLTGPVGTIYYIDPTDTAQYTTTAPPNNPFPVYQIIDTNGNAILLTAAGGSGGGGGGGEGPTGPTGPVAPYIFDGGSAASTYSLGPAFDCGSAV